MAQSLIEHGQVTTTLPKARTLRPYFEKLVTLAVRSRKLSAEDDAAGALRARRRIHKLLGDRGLIPKEHQESYEDMSDAHRAKTLRMASGRRYRTGEPKGRMAFTAESVTHRLIETVAPRYENRPGGYTRVVQLPKRRVGDDAPLAVLQLVGDEVAPATLTKPGKTARKKRADARYAMAIQVSKAWAKKGHGKKVEAQAEAHATDAEAETTDSVTEPQGSPDTEGDEGAEK